jgi:hypothetical protein
MSDIIPVPQVDAVRQSTHRWTPAQKTFIRESYKDAAQTTTSRRQACHLIAEYFNQNFGDIGKSKDQLTDAISDFISYEKTKANGNNPTSHKRASYLTVRMDNENEFVLMFKPQNIEGIHQYVVKNEQELNDKLNNLLAEYPGQPTISIFKRVEPKISIRV